MARAGHERTSHVVSVTEEFRAFFVANYLDGDDTGGMVTARANRLADDVAEIFADFTEELIARERAKFAAQFTGSASSITKSDVTMQSYNGAPCPVSQFSPDHPPYVCQRENGHVGMHTQGHGKEQIAW